MTSEKHIYHDKCKVLMYRDMVSYYVRTGHFARKKIRKNHTLTPGRTDGYLHLDIVQSIFIYLCPFCHEFYNYPEFKPPKKTKLSFIVRYCLLSLRKLDFSFVPCQN